MKRSPEKSKCLTTREAVFMVVGFLFGGFATVAYLSEKEDSESTKRSEVSKVINIQVCEVGELDDEEKKKEPNEVLSTGQECGLSSEQISDSEILSRAHGIETKRLIEKMEDIFDEYCITNEEDRAAIENMVMEGYSEVFSVGELIHEKGQVWEMELENPTLPKVDDSLFSETVVLTEMPCKVDSPEEIEVSPGQEEIIRMLKEGKFLELWESRVDVDWMRKIANDVDLGSELSDFFDLLDSIQGKLKETDLGVRKVMACKLAYVDRDIMEPYFKNKEVFQEIKGFNEMFEVIKDIITQFIHSEIYKGFENECTRIIIDHSEDILDDL